MYSLSECLHLNSQIKNPLAVLDHIPVCLLFFSFFTFNSHKQSYFHYNILTEELMYNKESEC